MNTQVINIYRAPAGWETDPQYVYIGRKGHGFSGAFGNPLYTLEGYDRWLLGRLRTDLLFRTAVRDLSGKTLVCFCKPKPCHGDILARFADLLAAHAAKES
jgi:hypothetical protein